MENKKDPERNFVEETSLYEMFSNGDFKKFAEQ